MSEVRERALWMSNGGGSGLRESVWEGLEAPLAACSGNSKEARDWRQAGEGPSDQVTRALHTIVQSLEFMLSK